MPKRNVRMHFRVSEEENEIIREKMQETGIKSIGAYLRKMAVDGYCVRLEMADVKEVLRLLRINSNNINQYTKKAHETGCIYIRDVEKLQKSQEEIWILIKQLLVKLSEIT